MSLLPNGKHNFRYKDGEEKFHIIDQLKKLYSGTHMHLVNEMDTKEEEYEDEEDSINVDDTDNIIDIDYKDEDHGDEISESPKLCRDLSGNKNFKEVLEVTLQS